MQLPLFAPTSDWVAPALSSLPSWKGARRIAIDCETRDPDLRKLGIGVRRPNTYLAGVSFCIDGDRSYYLPIRHTEDNMDPVQVIRYLKENAAAFDGQLVGANLPYDLDWLAESGIHFPNVKFFRDVQIADPLIYELHDSYSLKNIGGRLGIESKEEDLLRQAAQAYGVDPKGGIALLPARFVGAYAERDVSSPLEILKRQEEKIEQHGLWDIWNLESRVLPVLVKLRRRGVLIDQDKLGQIEEWSLAQEREALEYVRLDTGYDVGVGNVWKAGAIAPALEAIGVRLGKTAQGKPQIDKDILGSIDHEVARKIAWARKVNKLRTTFASSVRTYMTNGRVHCTYNQIARETEAGDQRGARYGRLSCVDPNLQQQPSRDEFADMWRSIYVAEPDAIWGCLDYSQQEPRWTTHFAAVMKLEKAQEAAQAYWDNPLLDNHDFMAELTGLPRKSAKAIYLGLCYGEGGGKLCDDLGLPTRWAVRIKKGRERAVIEYADTKHEAMEINAAANMDGAETYMWRAAGEEGQRIIDTFDNRAPFIRKLAKEAEKQAKKVGEIKTIGGRKLHFPMTSSGQYDWTHKALNRLIQGSSADQTKMAVIEADAAGHYIQLQVHDELDGSFSSVQEAKDCAEIMKNCIPGTKVPFRVDVEVGPSWGEIKEAA